MNGGRKGGHDDWVALVVGCGFRMNGRFAPDAVIRAVAKFYYWSRGVFAKPRADYQHSKEFTRIWAGSTALRRPGWRFRFDDRDEHLGAIDHNAHRSCYA